MKTRWIVAFGLLLLALRGIAAADLALFGDEAFYWQCGQRLAPAYFDHPFMTALLVRGGTEALGPSTLGARALFLLIGAIFPFAMYWLARPLVGDKDARLAAGLSLVIPATAHLGLLALPDVPLLLFALLALGCFERALRGGLRWWLLSGIATALALCCHLRGVLIPFAFFLFLSCTRAGRAQWRRIGLWLYAPVATVGFLPVLLFNWRLDFRPLRFQGEERHAGGISWDGFAKHLPLQLAAVTPLLYVALIAALVLLWRRARRGEPVAALMVCFALAHLGVFLVTSPVYDSSHATIHWPAPGYLALIPFVPAVLRRFVARRPTPGRRFLAAAAPGLGAIVLLLAFVELSFHPFGVDSLRRPFAGYREVAEHLAPRLAGGRFGEPPLVVADNYILGGNLEQRLAGRCRLYVLDHAKNHEHGRAGQYELWERDEAALARLAGERAIVVCEKNQSSSGTRKPQSWARWVPHIASLLDGLTEVDRLEVFKGEGVEPKVFVFFEGTVRARP